MVGEGKFAFVVVRSLCVTCSVLQRNANGMEYLIVDDVDGGSRCGAQVAQARNTQMTYL